MAGETDGQGTVNRKVLIVEKIPKKKPLQVKTGATIKITKRKRKFLFSF